MDEEDQEDGDQQDQEGKRYCNVSMSDKDCMNCFTAEMALKKNLGMSWDASPLEPLAKIHKSWWGERVGMLCLLCFQISKLNSKIPAKCVRI